jgi:hypothetical protein
MPPARKFELVGALDAHLAVVEPGVGGGVHLRLAVRGGELCGHDQTDAQVPYNQDRQDQ